MPLFATVAFDGFGATSGIGYSVSLPLTRSRTVGTAYSSNQRTGKGVRFAPSTKEDDEGSVGREYLILRVTGMDKSQGRRNYIFPFTHHTKATVYHEPDPSHCFVSGSDAAYAKLALA